MKCPYFVLCNVSDFYLLMDWFSWKFSQWKHRQLILQLRKEVEAMSLYGIVQWWKYDEAKFFYLFQIVLLIRHDWLENYDVFFYWKLLMHSSIYYHELTYWDIFLGISFFVYCSYCKRMKALFKCSKISTLNWTQKFKVILSNPSSNFTFLKFNIRRFQRNNLI